VAAALWLLAVPLAAQPVEVIGAEGTAAGDLARQIAARGRYILLERDTVLPAGWLAPADLIVLDAEVRLAGEVRGDVAVLGGELFLRPGARIGGRVAVLGGEVYRSALASHGEILEVPVPLPTVREATGGEEGRRVRVVEPPPPPRIQLGGLFGLDLPTYDRVDGATLRAGASARLGRTDPGATLIGWGTLRTGRGSPGGGAELRIPVAEGVRASLRAARETHTNERWIRGDLANSAAALVLGNDVRDYYESDRLVLELARPGALAPIQGEWLWAPWGGVLISRDRPLGVSTTWAITGRDEMRRPNRQVEPGTLASLRAGTATAWRGRTSGFTGEAEAEWAPGGVGDFAFARLLVDGRWEMAALRTHRILVRGRGAASAGGEGAPPQRWSLLGGPSTLPTYPVAAWDGDHLAFVDTRYGIPLSQAEVPFLGVPELQLRAASGAAWRSGQPMPRWGQNLGVALRFFLVGVEAWVDPAASGLRPTLSFALGLSDW
jgi:hypothetical protein